VYRGFESLPLRHLPFRHPSLTFAESPEIKGSPRISLWTPSLVFAIIRDNIEGTFVGNDGCDR
jgi:hypothetical protein